MITITNALQHEEYRRIPGNLLHNLYGYVEHKHQPGQFLIAVLSNNLYILTKLIFRAIKWLFKWSEQYKQRSRSTGYFKINT